jgi:hypothetical protein
VIACRLPKWPIAAAIFLSAAGCGTADPAYTDLDHLNGLFIGGDDVYVVPDHAWRLEGDRGGSFRKAASLLFQLSDQSPDDYRVTFSPDDETADLHFLARWNGDPLWEAPQTGANGPLVIDIPATSLTPGLHRLRLDRVRELDDKPERKQLRNVFPVVEVERVGKGGRKKHRITRNGFLAGFLNFGITSRAPIKLSGALFRGSRSHTFALDAGRGAEAIFELENQSGGKARFAVAIDGTQTLDLEIERGGRRSARFGVPPGRHSITLATDGRPGGCFLWGAPHLRRKPGPDLPPVILITLDTTRRDFIPPFGDDPGLAPNLARFGNQATAFTNAYATAPWTLPSHASIFTGLYPSHHLAGVSGDPLAESWITLAERFRERGYQTAGFAGGHMSSSIFGIAQGFSHFRDPRGTQEPAAVITDAASDFIERHADLPIFLFVNYFDPHTPYSAPPEYQDRLGVGKLAESIAEVPVWGDFGRGESGAWATIANGGAPRSRAGLEFLRAVYGAEVAYMDDQIGRLLETLKIHGLYDRAMIVMVSDHGEYLGERGLFSHSYRLDLELTAIPLVIKWPGQREAEVVDALVSHVDLYPAIAAAAGLDVSGCDGIAFDRGDVGGLATRDHVYMEEHKSLFHLLPGPFKIADHIFGKQRISSRTVFYPGFIECQRRSSSGWMPDECSSTWEAQISGLPEGMRATLEQTVTDSVLDIDPEEAEKLRALGYLN